LDVEVSRRIMDFHNSRKIKARHGRIIVREGQIYFRWCVFPIRTRPAHSRNSSAEKFRYPLGEDADAR
jgi:hypothetical protein